MKIEEKLIKKIKKDIYAKPQAIIAVPPPGFKQTALDEINSILKDLWFPQKYISECDFTGKNIYIKNIQLVTIMELLMRTRCLADLRLVIFSGKSADIRSFKNKCRNVAWNYFIDPTVPVKLKVDAIPGKATILKNILGHVLNENDIKIIDNKTTEIPIAVFVELQQEKLVLSVSLAGEPLYKRGYRGVLSSSAPLREDAASCCILKSLQFAKKFNPAYSAETIVVPFSGTGTFIFEYLQYSLNFSPVLFGRKYMLEKMPLFRAESFNFLLKKCLENCLPYRTPGFVGKPHFICMDTSKKANLAFAENITHFKHALLKNRLQFSDALFCLDESKLAFLQRDFMDFNADDLKNSGHIFIPLNPPYGVRLAKNGNPAILYKNIARKINEIIQVTRANNKNLSGFILCPDEATWRVFCKNLAEAKMETYHFTQGGMDIRVCQFFML